MALTGSISQDVPGTLQSITFSNPTFLDSITYSSAGITYPVAASFTLSQSDFALFYAYKSQFYASLLQNFSSIIQSQLVPLPVALMEIKNISGPDVLQYYQTSTSSPVYLVYNISYDYDDNIATFAARSSAITITLQEYLVAFQILKLFSQQVALV